MLSRELSIRLLLCQYGMYAIAASIAARQEQFSPTSPLELLTVSEALSILLLTWARSSVGTSATLTR
jgi:hypothetical protein